MKSENRNGKVVVVNETFDESLITFNEILEELGEKPVDAKEAKDWIKGGETNAELDEIAKDLLNEKGE